MFTLVPSGYLGVFALVPSGHRARAQSLNATFSQRPSESRKAEITNLIEFENIWVYSSTRSFASPSDPKKKNLESGFKQWGVRDQIHCLRVALDGRPIGVSKKYIIKMRILRFERFVTDFV